MNTCTFTIHFKTISVRFKVFVKCIICVDELKSSFSSSSSSFWSVPLNHEASPNTEKLKRACIESFQCVNTLGSQKPTYNDGTNFIA